jgi:hypothetical protein
MEARSKTVFIVTIAVEPDWEAELNRWYDEEHIPELLKVPGYQSARRYQAVEGEPKYMALYEIDSVADAQGEAHRVAIETPWTFRMREHFTAKNAFYHQVFPSDGVLRGPAWGQPEGGLMAMRLGTKPANEADFNAWYDQEHLPALSAVPGVIACRRFSSTDATPKYLAIYHLTSPEVQASAEWKKAIDTPWSARVRDHFTDRWRVVYRPLQ